MNCLWREVDDEDDLRWKMTIPGQLHAASGASSTHLCFCFLIHFASSQTQHNFPASFSLRLYFLTRVCLASDHICHQSLESCTRRLVLPLSPWLLRRERVLRPRSTARQQSLFTSNSSTVSTTSTISPNTTLPPPRVVLDHPVDRMRFADHHLPRLLLRFPPTSRSTHGSPAHYASSHSFSHRLCPHYFLIPLLALGSVSD